MAKDFEKCARCRRAGEKLFLKGDRCISPKCAVVRKPYAPGMHGSKMRRGRSEYGMQLAMKQKIKTIYGVLERQFRKHYREIQNKPGVTGDNLISRLEMRLDNVVYRIGLAASRNQAKQLVSHGFIEVNGKKVDIVSCEVKVGDVISVRSARVGKTNIKNMISVLKNKKDFPSWLDFDQKEMTAKIIRTPLRDDIEFSADPQAVVEYYSR